MSFSQWALGNSGKQFLPPSNFSAEKGMFKFITNKLRAFVIWDQYLHDWQLEMISGAFERDFVLGDFPVGIQVILGENFSMNCCWLEHLLYEFSVFTIMFQVSLGVWECLGVWEYDCDYFLKYFFKKYILKWCFFIFLKIIFYISASKWSENNKKILIWSNKKILIWSKEKKN